MCAFTGARQGLSRQSYNGAGTSQVLATDLQGSGIAGNRAIWKRSLEAHGNKAMEEVKNISMEKVRGLDDRGWEVLLRRIRDGSCTPILGAGVYSNGTSIRSNIARKWAAKYEYPLSDCGDLARVARFLSVEFADAEYAASRY